MAFCEDLCPAAPYYVNQSYQYYYYLHFARRKRKNSSQSDCDFHIDTDSENLGPEKGRFPLNLLSFFILIRKAADNAGDDADILVSPAITGILNDEFRDCMRSPNVCPSKLGSRLARRYTKKPTAQRRWAQNVLYFIYIRFCSHPS